MVPLVSVASKMETSANTAPSTQAQFRTTTLITTLIKIIPLSFILSIPLLLRTHHSFLLEANSICTRPQYLEAMHLTKCNHSMGPCNLSSQIHLTQRLRISKFIHIILHHSTHTLVPDILLASLAINLYPKLLAILCNISLVHLHLHHTTTIKGKNSKLRKNVESNLADIYQGLPIQWL